MQVQNMPIATINFPIIEYITSNNVTYTYI